MLSVEGSEKKLEKQKEDSHEEVELHQEKKFKWLSNLKLDLQTIEKDK